MLKQVNVTEKVKVRRRNASSVSSSLNSSLVQVKVKTCQAGVDDLSVTSRGEISSVESADETSVVNNCENRKVQPARVFVLSKSKKPLMPCSRRRAYQLLKNGKAVVHKVYPLTIRLKYRTAGEVQPISVKLDPGSKTTGIAVCRESKEIVYPLFLAELTHRGCQISKKLKQRAMYRRRRRSANLRYRPARFNNRAIPKGWLPPSIKHRVDSTINWVKKISKLCPVTELYYERVNFDMQKMQNPEISGKEYQQGELTGYEVKEYLLEKFNRTCVYCKAKGVPLEVEHIHPKSKGGSNRVSNLTLACRPCNRKKGSRDIREFLSGKPELLASILGQVKKSLKDASVVNACKNSLHRELQELGLPVYTGTGAHTKYNRKILGIPKGHALDAVCVGEVAKVEGWNKAVLSVTCMGRGSYQRSLTDKYGFFRCKLTDKKSHFGFITGDMVKAVVLKGKKAGKYTGRVAVRKSGSFDIAVGRNVVQGISYKNCKIIQRADGYKYK